MEDPNSPDAHDAAARSAEPLARDRPLPLRLVVGLGDPERERALLPAFDASGDVVVVERCLTADQLLAYVERGPVDVALVACDLHRLSNNALEVLARTRVPLVLLAPHTDEPRWPALAATVLPLDADPAAVRRALLAVVRGEHPPMATTCGEPQEDQAECAPALVVATDVLSPLAVVSGHGSPGRTTVAVSLAAALGAVAPTVLVDADLAGPSVAAYLDLDPTRNLSMLVHAEPATPREWERALAQETQPLGGRSPHAVVLCGVPKPAMRNGIAARFIERLAAELQQRYRYVIFDLGADLVGTEATIQHTVLGLSRQILLVASADLVGLWHARTALGLLKSQLPLGPERIALVVNRHDRRYHHTRTEIAWALSMPAAAVIPYDHGAAQRALQAQRPLVLDNRSRAGRALLDLATRIHGGSIILPPEPIRDGRARWKRWASALRVRWPRLRGVAPAQQGVPHGDEAPSVR